MIGDLVPAQPLPAPVDVDRPAGPDGEFRATAATFATGVTIASTVADTVPAALTVSAFTPVSLEPELLLICVRDGSRFLATLARSRVFAVTVLASDQADLARWFADRTRPSGTAAFAGVETVPARSGCPIFPAGLAYFDCALETVRPGGDHAIVIGVVRSLGRLRRKPPLLYYNRALGDARRVAGVPGGAGTSPSYQAGCR